MAQRSRVWRSGLVALLPVGMFGLIACDGDGPTDPPGTPPLLTRNARAAELQLHVTLMDTAGGLSLSLGGILIPGDHAVLDDTLWVLGRPFVSPRVFAEGSREYRGTIEDLGDSAPLGPLEIIAPRVEGVAPDRPRLEGFVPIGRAGPNTIEVESGALPILSITPAASLPPPRLLEWSLEIDAGDGEQRVVSGRGPPPERIPVPGALLPEGVRAPVRAIFHWRAQSPFSELPDGVYRLETHFTVVLDWTIVPREEE